MILPSQIEERRAERSLSRQDLADALGVTYETVRQWELGLVQPRPQLYPALNDILGIVSVSFATEELEALWQMLWCLTQGEDLPEEFGDDLDKALRKIKQKRDDVNDETKC